MCEDYTLRNVIISSKPSLAQTRQDPSLLRVHNRQFAGAQTYVQVRGKTGVNAAIVIPFCFVLFLAYDTAKVQAVKKHGDTPHFKDQYNDCCSSQKKTKKFMVLYGRNKLSSFLGGSQSRIFNSVLLVIVTHTFIPVPCFPPKNSTLILLFTKANYFY